MTTYAVSNTHKNITEMMDTRDSVMRAVLRKSWDLGTKSAESEETNVCDIRPISRGSRNLYRESVQKNFSNNWSAVLQIFATWTCKMQQEKSITGTHTHTHTQKKLSILSGIKTNLIKDIQ